MKKTAKEKKIKKAILKKCKKVGINNKELSKHLEVMIF